MGRRCDLALAAFFALNVPLVLLIDSTAVLPASMSSAAIKRLVNWHIATTGDYLMRDKPAFFRSLVVAELGLQLPLYVANAYAFYAGKQWGRMTGIVYGVHTATTMLPILFDIAYSQVQTKVVLFCVYLPYLIMPLLVLARLLPDPHPFAAKNNHIDNKKTD